MENISTYKNIHDGKRLFIMASGPSLKLLDLEPLSRRMVMGLNRSVRIYPDAYYHCMFDDRLFDELSGYLGNIRKLFTLEGKPCGVPLHLLGAEGFSWDLEKGIYSGYTVAYFGLQVAVYMGFKEIVYLGLDLSHKDGNTHFFGHDFHSQNHEETEFPRMAKTLTYGAKVLSESGIKVFNCSPTSSLECFLKISYEEAIAL
jgi:hypothetical protein